MLISSNPRRTRRVRREPVAAIREIYEAWLAGDKRAAFEAGEAIAHPDLELVFRTGEAEPIVHRGDQAGRALYDWLLRWEAYESSIEELIQWRRQVVVVLHARNPAEDREIPVAHVWHMQRGRAVRLVIYADATPIGPPE